MVELVPLSLSGLIFFLSELGEKRKRDQKKEPGEKTGSLKMSMEVKNKATSAKE